jgi:hypothetical protein
LSLHRGWCVGLGMRGQFVTIALSRVSKPIAIISTNE